MIALAPQALPSRIKIAIRGIAMSFGRMQVLKDVNIDLREGELVCLVGPSGCGKSTLLNIVGGFLTPTGGEIRIDNETVRGPDPRRIFVFQERGVFPWLTVEGNIAFGLKSLSPSERARTVAHYIQLVGLRGFERAYPDALSGGMKQRVEVARALAVRPDVLYLDEPFGALDWMTRLQMRAEILRILQVQRKTILFVTHDIEEAVQLADRVVVMSTPPATVRRVFEIDLRHPRDLSSARYLQLRDSILEEIGLAHRI